MDIFLPVWDTFLVHPIQQALLELTRITGNAGWAIILFTLGIRTLLLPLGIQQARSQRNMAKLQPQLREIQKKFAGDRAKQSQEQMRLYRETGINPAAGCLPLFLQFPIWFALYAALNQLANHPEEYPDFQAAFLWLPSLAQHDPIYILPVLTGATQWVVQRMSTMPVADPQQQSMNRALEFMPIMFVFFALNFPSGLAVYWVTSNIYSFVQQYFLVGWGNLP